MSTTTTCRTFSIHNHVSRTIVDETAPWVANLPIPDFETKDQFRAWCAAPTTRHLFFSTVEGENPSLRCGPDNPPMRLHGIVADYDCPGMTDEEIQRGLARQSTDYPLYAWNRTFSGGIRAVWMFEAPVFALSKAALKAFLAKCKRELRVRDMFAGLDDGAFEDPFRTYTAGDGWSVPGAIVRSNALELWALEASSKEDWKDRGRAHPPIDEVAAKLAEKFGPEFWGGREFRVGSRGTRFWESGDSMSVIVREGGLQCFTGDKPFVPWDDVCGREWIQKFLENRIGAAIKDLFSDGQKFWRQIAGERWLPMDIDTTKRHLMVKYGLNPNPPKGESISEIQTVLHRLETHKWVRAGLPFPCNPNTIVNFNGDPHLNVSSVRAVMPALDPCEWGEGFPFLAAYVSKFFKTEEGMIRTLAWLKHAYIGCYDGEPTHGQALFIVGPPGTGKTLFAHAFLGRIFGGAADAGMFMVDGEKYNDSLFERYLWQINDSMAATDARAHARFTTGVKACVANPTSRYQKKYGANTDIPFNGRLVVTMNDDAASLEMLPNLDVSIKDKLILVQTTEEEVELPCRGADLDRLIDSELPFFLSWLLQWVPPADIVGPLSRFGYASHIEIELLDEAQASSPTGSLVEIVDLFRLTLRRNNPERKEWWGTTTELHSAMMELAETKHSCPKNPIVLGRMLRQAMAQGYKGAIPEARGRGSESRRGFKIVLD